MDNVTHSLTGLALARAGLNRFSPRATLLLILSANASDIDIIAALRGPLAYFKVHRGYTHSLICLPVLAILPVLVTMALLRERLPWLRAWALCCVGVASHLLLDWTNSYGVRLLLPLSSRWFHLDLNSLYDACILVVLVFAAVWPFFAGLVSREIGHRGDSARATAIFALALFLLFDLGRLALHTRAIAQLESRLFDDAPPLQTAALPNAFNPLQWTGVIETPSRFALIPVNLLGQLDMEESQSFFKPAITPSLENAKRLAAFRYFLYFARFPVWSESPVAMDPAPGRRVQLTDLRFGVPGAGSFHCIALEDHSGQILQYWFTFGSGASLGWAAHHPALILLY